MASGDPVETWFTLVVLAVIGVPVIYYFAYLVPKRQREAVEKDVVARGGKVLSIKEAFFFSLFSERNTRRWRVTFTDSAGREITAKVQTSLFTGLRWIDGPFA